MASEQEIEAACRRMMAASRPYADPDALTPAPRGTAGNIKKWETYRHLAEAAPNTASPDPVAGQNEEFDAWVVMNEGTLWMARTFQTKNAARAAASFALGPRHGLTISRARVRLTIQAPAAGEG